MSPLHIVTYKLNYILKRACVFQVSASTESVWSSSLLPLSTASLLGERMPQRSAWSPATNSSSPGMRPVVNTQSWVLEMAGDRETTYRDQTYFQQCETPRCALQSFQVSSLVSNKMLVISWDIQTNKQNNFIYWRPSLTVFVCKLYHISPVPLPYTHYDTLTLIKLLFRYKRVFLIFLFQRIFPVR